MRVVKCKTLEIEEWHIEKWRESTGRNRQTNWSESWRYYYTVTNEFNASEFLWNWIALPELFCIFTSRVHFNNAALAAVFADSSFTFLLFLSQFKFHFNFISLSLRRDKLSFQQFSNGKTRTFALQIYTYIYTLFYTFFRFAVCFLCKFYTLFYYVFCAWKWFHNSVYFRCFFFLALSFRLTSFTTAWSIFCK